MVRVVDVMVANDAMVVDVVRDASWGDAGPLELPPSLVTGDDDVAGAAGVGAGVEYGWPRPTPRDEADVGHGCDVGLHRPHRGAAGGVGAYDVSAYDVSMCGVCDVANGLDDGAESGVSDRTADQTPAVHAVTCEVVDVAAIGRGSSAPHAGMVAYNHPSHAAYNHGAIRLPLIQVCGVDTSEDFGDLFLGATTSRHGEVGGVGEVSAGGSGCVQRLAMTGGVVLPSDTVIHLSCGSRDVIHSWAVPGLGFKIDCIPGYNCHRRAVLRWRGLFWGQCMEVCGRYHHWMPILVRVAQWEYWSLWVSAVAAQA